MPRYKMMSPLLLLSGGKAQALEGNRHPNHEAAIRHLAARIPDGIKRGIEMSGGLLLARSLGPYGVPLHAERRGLKGVGAAAVVEGVEDDLRPDRRHECLRGATCGRELSGIVEAYEDHVKIFLVVAQVGVGRFRDAFAVVRVALGEAGYFRHFEGDFPLRLHAEEVVEQGSASATAGW